MKILRGISPWQPWLFKVKCEVTKHYILNAPTDKYRPTAFGYRNEFFEFSHYLWRDFWCDKGDYRRN